MSTNEILKEIQLLPINKQMIIIEMALKSIRENEKKMIMRIAADTLLNDYQTDNELTIFTNIDYDNFYEAR